MAASRSGVIIPELVTRTCAGRGYRIYRESDHTLCAEGHTTQLFIDPEGELMTDLPDYYEAWQGKYLGIGREELLK